jgi:hypothetical protein
MSNTHATLCKLVPSVDWQERLGWRRPQEWRLYVEIIAEFF